MKSYNNVVDFEENDLLNVVIQKGTTAVINASLTGKVAKVGFDTDLDILKYEDSVGTKILASRDWVLSSGNAVTSVFGRTGVVTAQSGDYTFAQINSKPTTIGGYGITDVTSQVLTGLNITGGSIVAVDTILQGFGKLQNQISSLLSGVDYQGVWNANTNSPALASGVGTKGHYYVVNVDGATNLDGIVDWKVGDWVIFNGTAWNKVDNTDAVSSVNGFTGAVSLTTANISEVTNLYYTNARGIGSVLTGYVSGSGTVVSTDTVLQAIQKLNGNIGTNIVRTSQVNTYGLFAQTFPNGVLSVQNPLASFSYTVLGSAIVANRNITLPLLTGNDTFVMQAHAQTLTNKTMTSPILNTPRLGTTSTLGYVWTATDAQGNGSWQAAAGGGGPTVVKTDQANTYTSGLTQQFWGSQIRIMNNALSFGYFIASSAITADRDITLPLLTSSDTFVFQSHAQTLTNKTLTAPVINGATTLSIKDVSAAFNVIVSPSSSQTLTANRTLFVDVRNANRSLGLRGDVTFLESFTSGSNPTTLTTTGTTNITLPTSGTLLAGLSVNTNIAEGSWNGNTDYEYSVAVTGASPGDFCLVRPNNIVMNGINVNNTTWDGYAYCSSPNVVTVVCRVGSFVSIAGTQTFTVKVLK